jgi:exportin-7
MQDLALGYMSGKLLLKLEAVHFMLAHHTSTYYNFLEQPVNTRNRYDVHTAFLAVLGWATCSQRNCMLHSLPG